MRQLGLSEDNPEFIKARNLLQAVQKQISLQKQKQMWLQQQAQQQQAKQRHESTSLGLQDKEPRVSSAPKELEAENNFPVKTKLLKHYTISEDLTEGDGCIARRKLIALRDFSGDHCFKDPTYPIERAKTSPSRGEESASQRMHTPLGRIQDSRSHSHGMESDDAYPHSPGLKPVRVKATPSPSPPPFIPQQTTLSSPENVSPHSLKKRKKPNRRKTRPIQGDTILINFMDPNRPDIARLVGERALNRDSGSEADDDEIEERESEPATSDSTIQADRRRNQ